MRKNAALTRWMTTSHEHLRAYERALLERGCQIQIPADVRVNIEGAIVGYPWSLPRRGLC